MYFYDHDPLHFHAEYAEYHAAIAIGSNAVLVGSLPGRALKPVTEWAVCTARSWKPTGSVHETGGLQDRSTRCRKMSAWSSYVSPL
jgi:hypothetical protein